MNEFKIGKYVVSRISVFVAIPIFLFILLRTLGFDGLYGQDSYEYIRYADRFKEYLTGGVFPGDVVWPKAYLIILALFSFVIKSSFAGQLISLLSLYGVYYFLKKTIEEIHGDHKDTQIILILGLLLSPYVLRISVVVMADTFAMLSVIGTAYYFIRYKKTDQLKQLTLCVLFGFLGVFSRYAVLVAIAPIFLWAIFHWVKIKKWSHVVVLLIPIILFGINLYFEGSGSKFTNHHFIEKWSVLNIFKSEFLSPENSGIPSTFYFLPNGVFYFLSFLHPGFFGLIAIALLMNFKKFKSEVKSFPLPFLCSILIYSLFLSGITFQGNRYITLTYPLFLVFTFPAVKHLFEKTKKYKQVLVYGMLLIQLSLFVRAMLPSYEMNLLERTIAEEMKEYEGNVLYSFEVDISMQERDLSFDYKSLWVEKYTRFEKGAYCLFNVPRISKNYQNRNPMINWEKLNKAHQLTLVKEIKQGWKLYQIEE